MENNIIPADNKYSSSYSESSLWEKIKECAKIAGEKIILLALKLYYSLMDEDTPLWAKSIIIATLGYFISPIDAIPDITPAVGYTDDLGVLTIAATTVAMHIKDEHVRLAKEKFDQWFA